MTTWVRNLLIINVLAFLVRGNVELLSALVFVPTLVLERPWTLVTYMFLHANLSHLFFNMLGLYFFGSRLEMRLGERRFLTLYFISGIMGALVSLVVTPRAALIGASGAIFGVMLGYARYWPRDLVYIWGVLPVQARWLVVIMTGLELTFGGTGIQSGVAHFAHLGGFLGALLYLLWVDRNSPAARFKAQATPVPRAGSMADIERWRKIPQDGMHPVNKQEVERLLDKILSGGVSSLTPDEKAFLDRMSP